MRSRKTQGRQTGTATNVRFCKASKQLGEEREKCPSFENAWTLLKALFATGNSYSPFVFCKGLFPTAF
jgi:hypothetical protein